MLWYIKTECPDNVILSRLKRYYKMYSYKINEKIPINISLYLKNNYDVDAQKVINKVYKNLRVSNIKDDFHQIYILDDVINNTKLSELINLLEFGNRDIQPIKLISNIFNNALSQVKYSLGGI